MSDCSSFHWLESGFRLLSNAAAVEVHRQGVFTVYLFIFSSSKFWSTSIATKPGSLKRENAGIISSALRLIQALYTTLVFRSLLWCLTD
jgi:hypothetical protein